ncbi:MAG: hypothetical protein NVS3B1_30230 [Marmoricola sp.]
MRVSASKAALLSACAFPFREGTSWVKEQGRSAINGDRFHRAMASYLATGVRPVETGRRLKWLEDRLDHAIAWVDTNRSPTWRAEVAYTYDPQTGMGRILGYDIGREYEKHGKLPHEIVGSADIAGMEGETVLVADWKTGRSISDDVWSQMEWLCLMAARATGAWHARALVLHATDYGIVPAERIYDDVALARIAAQLRVDVGAIEDAWPVAGPHCDACYCPARAGCDLYQLGKKDSAA